MALAKQNRLSGNKRFQDIIRSRGAISSHSLGMKVVRTRTDTRKCAVVVPVRVAALATQRNALRRAVVTVVSTLVAKTSPGYEAIITVRTDHLPSHADLEHEVMSLFVESGILTK